LSRQGRVYLLFYEPECFIAIELLLRRTLVRFVHLLTAYNFNQFYLS